MTPTTLRSPTLKLGNRTTTPRSEKQDSPAINGSHPPKLSSQTLVIRIPLAPSFPRQPIDLLAPSRSRSNAILRLYLQIKLHGLLQPFAPRVPTFSRSRPAAQVEEGDGGGEEEGEGEEVGGGGDGGEIGGGEVGGEEGEGVEEVGEVGGEEEGGGEEDEEED